MIRFGRRRKLSRVPVRSSRASKSSAAQPTASAPPDEGFAIDEERFFNEPETLTEELSASVREGSPFSSTLAPTVMDGADAVGVPSEHDTRDSEPEGAVNQTRRKRLRRAVAGTLCASAALLLLGITRHSADGIRTKASAPPAHFSAATARAVSSGSHLETPLPPALPPGPPPAPLVSTSAPARTFDRAAGDSARALVRTARALLQAGQIRAGVSVARQALAANSSDAEPYILLAAGLQDLGEWSAAQTVFAECNQRAKRGSSSDCRYFSHQKP